MDFHTSSCYQWSSFIRYRYQTWSDATTGRTSLSGPLWAPWLWRNVSKRYTHHMRETKLLVHQQTIHLQTLWHLWDNVVPSNVVAAQSEQVKVDIKPSSLLPGRTAQCHTVSLWTEVCCFCFSFTPACCPLCPWERVYSSSTCHASSTGVAARRVNLCMLSPCVVMHVLVYRWKDVLLIPEDMWDKCVIDVQSFFVSVCWRTYIPERHILKNRLVVSLLEKWVQFPGGPLKGSLQLVECRDLKWL